MKLNHIDSFPLLWPEGFQRTISPSRSRFDKKSIGSSTDELNYQLGLLGAKNVVISTNLKVKNNGLPYSQQKQPTDQGVSVYFTLKGNQRVLACDKWNRIEDNLWAVAKTVEAMRGIDRWGVSDMLDRMFTGFLALPSSTGWRTVLGLKSYGDKIDMVTIKNAYYAKAKLLHPDMGGSESDMSALNNAYQEALKENGYV